MSKSIVIVGYGPGVSAAVAEKFGAEGFSVGIVARNAEKLAAAVAALKAKGVTAAGFRADAGDADAVRAAVRAASAELGPITVLHWNAVAGTEIGDIFEADPAAVVGLFDSPIVGFLSAVQAALPDLRTQENAAVLLTNGLSGDVNDFVDGFAVARNVMGLALVNATKAKLIGLLAQKLKPDGIYVGQVLVAGLVKGSRPDIPGGIEISVIADKFWDLYQGRTEIRARVS